MKLQRRFVCLLVAAVCALALVPAAALACPAYGGEVEVTDGDGNTLTVRNYGDEFFSYTTDARGNLLCYNPADGCYYFVVQDGSSFAKGQKVGGGSSFWDRFRKDDLRPLVNGKSGAEIKDKLLALRATLSKKAGSLSGLDGANQPYAPVPENYDYANDALRGKFVVDNDNHISPEKTDTCALLVLKVQYTDVKCQFSDAAWFKHFFEDGVARYYTEVSGGKFTYVPVKETSGTPNDGIITVTLPIGRPGYDCGYNPARSGAQNYANGAKLGLYRGRDGKDYAFFSDAAAYAYGLAAADAFIDVSQYDRNGDGYIAPTEMAVIVVHAGYEASYTGDREGEPMTWAHSWILNNWRVNNAGTAVIGDGLDILLDGKKLYKYTIVGENLNDAFDYYTQSQQARPQQAEFGAAAHELGHDLGLADLYDTDYTPQQYEVGALSLMAGGSWGCTEGMTPGSSPTHLDPYSKIWLGFYNAETISESGVYPVTQSSDSADYNILRVNTLDPNVYYLIENRTLTGQDKGLYNNYSTGNTGGAVYWRIDEAVVAANWDANAVNNTSGHYGVMPVYAEYISAYPNENRPFRNKSSYDELEQVHTVTSSPKTTLICYDETAADMNVWLNIGELAEYPLTLTDRSYILGSAPNIKMTLGSNTPMTAADLASVTVDGRLLGSPEQYTVESGSIVIVFPLQYLNTLAPGVHTVRVTLLSGQYAEATLTVRAPAIPKAGDASQPGALLAAVLLAGAALAVRLIRRKRGKA